MDFILTILVEVVIPCQYAGVAGFGLGPVAFDVVSMLLRKEGVITHVLACEAAIQGRDRDKDGEKVQRFPHFF